MSRIYLLCALRGAGKTTFCRALADEARSAGCDVAGILSPPVLENGQKVGILAQALRTGETCPLAITSHLSLSTLRLPLSTAPLSTFHLPLGNWLFSPSALAWGNDILASCLPCDLLIVDELGPLELLRGEGWSAALTALRQPLYRVGLVVVRPELLEIAQSQLPPSQTITLPFEGDTSCLYDFCSSVGDRS